MKKILIRHFGLIIAVIMNAFVYGILTLFAILDMRFLIDPFEFLWGDAFAFFLRFLILVIITIIMFIYVKKKKWSLWSLLGYYIFFIFVFEKTFMFFLYGCSMASYGFSYNSDAGIAWVLVLPISFIVFVIVGCIFDYVKNKKMKKLLK